MLKKAKLSPSSNKNSILKIRKNIDKIDNKILHLLFLRKKEVTNIIKYKNKNQIIDKKRIYSLIKKLKNKGRKKKLEPYLIDNVWKAIIKSFIRFEKSKF